MKLKVLFLALVIFLVAGANAATLRGKCVAVTDGDTIKVLVNNQEIKVRLNGVDAPEKKQPFGTQAKKFTSNFCFGKDVVVYSTGNDRYGRTLGWVYVGNRSLSREIVSAGFAWWYRQYAPHNLTLQNAETSARTAKRGLWIDPHAIAPWEWRKGQR